MSKCTGTVIESQLDWLTFAVHTRDGVDWLKHSANRWATVERDAGNKVDPFRLMGYEGFRVGRVRYGERENAALVQLSGDLAEKLFDEVHGSQDSLTRIDLAVTVRLPEYQPDVAAEHFAEAMDHRAEKPHAARPQLVQDGDGGSTCYVGDRSSDWFLRVYNKQRECEHQRDEDGAERYQRCWRYELEVKGGAAAPVALLASRAASRSAWVQGRVYDYASAHGIDPRFPSTGDRVPLSGFRRRSDADTRLRWLRASVRPALEWLEGLGYSTEARKALGLDDTTA